MASYMPPGASAAVTLEVRGHRRTWRLDDLESFVLQPRDLRDLEDLPRPPELTEDFTLPASGGRITRSWSKSPPPPQVRPRTTQAELYDLVNAWLFSRAASGTQAMAHGQGFLMEELKRHGEEPSLGAFVASYNWRREREAEEDRAFGLLDDDEGDD